MAHEPTTTRDTLKVATSAQVKQELALADPKAIVLAPSDEAELEQRADALVQQLLTLDPEDMAERVARKQAVEQMGLDVQRRAARQSALLKQPVKALTARSQDGGQVANALLDLKLKVEELDPGKFDFEPGWFSRAIGRLPGVGTPLKRYFSKYESAQTVIQAIIRSLENGRDELGRDNVTLSEDQKQMRETTQQLGKMIKLGQMVDRKLEQKLKTDVSATDPRHKFIAEELLFPLRQRIIDLQQQLAVHQQGVLASEIIIRNNQELIRGVNRALNVTVTALEVGATVAMALANQQAVLDKVQSVNQTTSDLIKGTAERLKNQGAAIHKQAASAQIDLEALKSAFGNIKSAMDDVSRFRVEALPQMASTVLELDRLSAEAETAIQKIEEGNRTRPSIAFDIPEQKS